MRHARILELRDPPRSQSGNPKATILDDVDQTQTNTKRVSDAPRRPLIVKKRYILIVGTILTRGSTFRSSVHPVGDPDRRERGESPFALHNLTRRCIAVDFFMVRVRWGVRTEGRRPQPGLPRVREGYVT